MNSRAVQLLFHRWIHYCLVGIIIGLDSASARAADNAPIFTASTLQANASANSGLTLCGFDPKIRNILPDTKFPITVEANANCTRSLAAKSSISFDQFNATTGITGHGTLSAATTPAASNSAIGNLASNVIIALVSVTVSDPAGSTINFSLFWRSHTSILPSDTGLPPNFVVKASSSVCGVPCDVGLPSDPLTGNGQFFKPIKLAKGIWTISFAATSTVSSSLPSDPPTISSAGLLNFSVGGPYLVDGIPLLMKGVGDTPTSPTLPISSGVLADLATDRVVSAIAADGAAQVIIRIPASFVNEQIGISIKAGQCFSPSASTCVDDYGKLYDPSFPSDNIFQNTPTSNSIVLTAVQTTKGPMAFAAYRAPSDFVRTDSPAHSKSDAVAARRVVIFDLNAGQSGFQIDVIRPPVVLVHGFTSDPCSWDSFEPLISDPRFAIYKLDYSNDIDDRVSLDTIPLYPPAARGLNRVRANVVGVRWNARNLIYQIRQTLDQFSKGAGYTDICGGSPRLAPDVAAAQVDYIGHSMGGLIAREMWYLPNFPTGQNYGRGYIHKLIALGTPHLGSDVAYHLMDGSNDCVRTAQAEGAGILTGTPNFAFGTLKIDGEKVSGGAADLVGNDTVAGLSDLLRHLQSSIGLPLIPRLRMLSIAGQASQAQFDKITGTFGQLATFLGCGRLADNFLAKNFRGDLWRNVFAGKDSDAFVSVGSALNLPNTRSITSPDILLNVVHGHGTVEDLNFGPPHLQENASRAPQKVIDGLNSNRLTFPLVP